MLLNLDDLFHLPEPSVRASRATPDGDIPGSWLRRFNLDRPVVSCESAAMAKGVALEHELKSLLLACDHGFVLAHVRGDQRLSLRAVKSTLALEQARLAAPSALESLGLSPGTIHPFHPNLWRLTQLITRQVLMLPWVTTNAGELTRYVRFDPVILLRARQFVIGDYEA